MTLTQRRSESWCARVVRTTCERSIAVDVWFVWVPVVFAVFGVLFDLLAAVVVCFAVATQCFVCMC